MFEGFEQDRIRLADAEINLRMGGDGPPLLLVHGLMTAGYSWRYVLDGLGEHFTLVIPDLVGSGDSDKPPGRYDLPALAHLCDAPSLLSFRRTGLAAAG